MNTIWYGPEGWVANRWLQTFQPPSANDGTTFNTNVPGGSPAAPPTSQEVQVLRSLSAPAGTRVRRLTLTYRVSDTPIPGRPVTDFSRITAVELVEHVPGAAPASRFLDLTPLVGPAKSTYTAAVPVFVTSGALVLAVRLVYADAIDVVELYEAGLGCILPCTCREPKPPVVRRARKTRSRR